MPRAEKEFILNYATNRWQLNFKKNVGPTSDSIRLCNPSSYEEWRDYYYSNVRSREHIDRLYITHQYAVRIVFFTIIFQEYFPLIKFSL